MKDKIPHKLNQFYATAICGNDILSSALYVSGIAALYAGMYAPIVLLGVGVVLLLYRSVYREVVEALPVNGGAYNALLNSTSKISASVAGTMTILSYIATAVISAKTAVEYLLYFLRKLLEHLGNSGIAHTLEQLVIPATIGVLLVFAFLVIAGVKDSARVAAGIFTIHIISLLVFVIGGAIYIALYAKGGIWTANWFATQALVTKYGGVWQVIFFGFSVSLLGVSGFESSANFVEEQKEGVFAKTLRNMTAGVMFFNPLIAAVTLGVLPLAQIVAEKDFVLGAAGFHFGRLIMLTIIGFDAFLVLCGAVLTSYVGVSGLMSRMTMDSVLPNFLLSRREKKTNTRIILVFFALCASILLLTRGNLLSLAGVYTISFLSVMTLFAIGNLILRQTRPELKRPYRASALVVIFAAISTITGLMGNIEVDNNNVFYFLIYFVPAILVVLAMIFKKDFYRSFYHLFCVVPITKFRTYFERQWKYVMNDKYFVFIHHTSNLFPALEYVNKNEGGHNITFVHCRKGKAGEKVTIEKSVPILKQAGVYPYINTEFVYLNEEFGPETVKNFAKENRVSLSNIFIGSIHESHEFDYHEFGGVRIILE